MAKKGGATSGTKRLAPKYSGGKSGHRAGASVMRTDIVPGSHPFVSGRNGGGGHALASNITPGGQGRH
jgi:hypothetical protein